MKIVVGSSEGCLLELICQGRNVSKGETVRENGRKEERNVLVLLAVKKGGRLGGQKVS